MLNLCSCAFLCVVVSAKPPILLSSSSHNGVAGQVGDAAQVAAVTCHHDVALLSPGFAPAVKTRERWRERDASEPPPDAPQVVMMMMMMMMLFPSPVLDDPEFLPLGGHSEAHGQHGVIDVVLVAVAVVVDTCTQDGEEDE